MPYFICSSSDVLLAIVESTVPHPLCFGQGVRGETSFSSYVDREIPFNAPVGGRRGSNQIRIELHWFLLTALIAKCLQLTVIFKFKTY